MTNRLQPISASVKSIYQCANGKIHYTTFTRFHFHTLKVHKQVKVSLPATKEGVREEEDFKMISFKISISSLLVMLLVSNSSASLSSTMGFLYNRRNWNIALSTATIATVAVSTNACNLGWLFNRKHTKNDDVNDDDDLMSGHHIHRDPLLQIPCGLIIVDGDDNSSSGNDFNDIPPEQIHPLSTYVDTGVANTIITYEAAKRTGLLSLLPSSSSSKTKDGIQIIPEGSIWFRMGSEEATVLAPEIRVLPPTPPFNNRSKKNKMPSSNEQIPSKELILGLDFLRKYQTVIDLHDDELRIVVKLNNDNNQQVDDNKEGGVGENVADSVVVMIPLIRPRPVLDFGTPDL